MMELMEMALQLDTIAAIATPVGEGAIGIVRLSGPRSIDIVDAFFKGKQRLRDMKSHRLAFGELLGEDGAAFDTVLVALMRAPHSYTGEDIVEIHCHGGRLLVSRVLSRVLGLGARSAERGEFTQRALLNGKLDLAQAEAVIDLIQATSAKGLEIAAGQLKGRLSEEVAGSREAIADVLTHLQAVIDYPEEDLIELQPREIVKQLTDVKVNIDRLRQTIDVGKIYHEGLRMGIVGRPNVGKSSLMNRILGEDRSIVTPIPGTTRDVVEAHAMLEDVAFTLFDTAGIRESDDPIERIGVSRTEAVIREADIVLFLLDGSEPLNQADKDIYGRAIRWATDVPVIVGVNKSDLDMGLNLDDVRHMVGEVPIVLLSARTGNGIDQLAAKAIALAVGDATVRSDAVIVTRERHRQALDGASESIHRAIETIGQDLPVELVSVDLQEALQYLGEVTGESVSDEIVGRIFAQFCVGK